MSTPFVAVNGLSAGASATPILDSSGNYIGGNVSDMLSNRVNSENQMTGAGTAVISSWNRIKSLTNNVTITLPSAVSNSGKFIGIIIDQSCGNYLVTLQDSAGAYIDYDYLSAGVTARIMWCNEVALLYSNGTYWHKVQGRTIPMSVAITLSGNQTPMVNVNTLIAMTTLRFLNAPSSMVTLATPVITIKRPGYYKSEIILGFNNTNTSTSLLVAYIYKTGANLEGLALQCPASSYTGITCNNTSLYSVNDTLQPYGKYTTGSYVTTALIGTSNTFTVTEIPKW